MNMEPVATDKNPPMEATAHVEATAHAEATVPTEAAAPVEAAPLVEATAPAEANPPTEANTRSKKKTKLFDNASEKVLIGTFISQITICIVIVLGFLISRFYPDSNVAASSESITLSLIGMAISVWIGLNIYNTISKDDLHTLKENLLQLNSKLQLNTTQAKEATERVYIEILKSKFRMSSSNTASKYFADQIDTIGAFPTDIYNRILKLEDLFQIS